MCAEVGKRWPKKSVHLMDPTLVPLVIADAFRGCSHVACVLSGDVPCDCAADHPYVSIFYCSTECKVADHDRHLAQTATRDISSTFEAKQLRLGQCADRKMQVMKGRAKYRAAKRRTRSSKSWIRRLILDLVSQVPEISSARRPPGGAPFI